MEYGSEDSQAAVLDHGTSILLAERDVHLQTLRIDAGNAVEERLIAVEDEMEYARRLA